MKTLITGSAGQVGRALLASAPEGVQAIGVTHLDLDITDAEAVAVRLDALRPDVIINAAAYTAVDRAEDEAQRAHAVNAAGAAHLAAGAQRIGARLIHISTDFIFDGEASRPYGPDAAPHPLSVYGRSKLAGEEAVLAADPRALILRTAWVYAPEGHNFLRTMLRLMRERGAVRVICDQVGTPTAAGPLADVLWWLSAHPEVQGTHHWTDAGVASWYDFAVAIAEEGADCGLLPDTIQVTPIATEDYPTRARRPAYSVLDKTSLVRLGLVPEHWRRRLRGVLRALSPGQAAAS